VKESRIVFLISLLKQLAEVRIYAATLRDVAKLSVNLDVSVFAYAQEYQPIDGSLDGEVKLAPT